MEIPAFPSTRLHHIGIIVPNRERVDMLVDLLGLPVRHSQYVPEYEADCIFAGGDGGSCLEFVIPRGGKLAGFNHGLGGLHHIALEVQDMDAFVQQLQSRGIKLLEQSFVTAGASMRVNFLPPVYTRGIIIEFVEVVPPSAADLQTNPSSNP